MSTTTADLPYELSLVIRAGGQLYALPLDCVAEIMRPQPVRAVAGGPPFVLGVAVIRGVPVPVVDGATTLGDGTVSSSATRFVSVKTGDRQVALAVDEVIGVRSIERTQLSGLPPLMASIDAQVISAIGLLDRELLMVLRCGRLLPEDLWPL